MFRQSVKNLAKMKKGEVKQFINTLDNILTDCDGVLWIGDRGIQKSAETINRLRGMGKRIFYVTNNSKRSRDKVTAKCKRLNYEEVITSGYLAALYLKSMAFNKKVYLIGHAGIASELDLVGIKHTDIGPDVLDTDFHEFIENVKFDPDIGAVVVGYDEYISFPKILKGATYLKNPACLFIATNTDRNRRSSDNKIVIPGAGSILAGVRTCSQRKPIIMGKPSLHISNFLINEYNLEPKRTLMIGDKYYCTNTCTRSGFKTLLVLTGVTLLTEVMHLKESGNAKQKNLIPDVYLEKLGDLLDFLD